MTGLIIDLALIAVLVLTVIISIKQGFVKVLLGLVGIAVAFVAASWLSSVSSEFIFDKIVAPAARTSIVQTVENVSDESKDGILNALPESVYSAAKVFNIDIEGMVEENIGNSISQSAEQVSEAIVSNVLRPFVTSIARMLLFVIFFILLFILIKLLTKALNLVAKLPVLKTANKTLGGLLGLVKGILFVYIICFILKLSLNFIDGGLFGINEEILEASYIASFLQKF